MEIARKKIKGSRSSFRNLPQLKFGISWGVVAKVVMETGQLECQRGSDTKNDYKLSLPKYLLCKLKDSL